MKRLLISIALFIAASVCYSSNPKLPKGTYITLDREIMYTFVNDSLYIDKADSGCGMYALKLVYDEENDSYKGEQTFSYNGKSFTEVYHLAFHRLNKKAFLVWWESQAPERISKIP